MVGAPSTKRAGASVERPQTSATAPELPAPQVAAPLVTPPAQVVAATLVPTPQVAAPLLPPAPVTMATVPLTSNNSSNVTAGANNAPIDEGFPTLRNFFIFHTNS